ncbi:serine/threonine protein kinase [Archangium violaceum]|nr:serine/threonine protein kinase [Archangium violaceum]
MVSQQAADLGGYEVIGRLAVGGMAEVFQVRAKASTQRSPGEPEEVVLKRLLPTYRNDGAYVKAFVDEAKLTVRLRHPHIVRTFRLFKAGPDYLMVQELVAGRTLGFMQELLMKAGAAMPPAAACYITWCVLKALDYVHRAKAGEGGATIVHRDVNPANILLSVAGDVKLTDFGVADVEGVMRGDTGALRGTVSYMSPEQVLGQPVDTRSDLYSVGVILWELLSNRRLFTGDGEAELMHRVRDARAPLLSSVQPELPDYAVQVVRKALFADKARRFQSAAEFIRALEVLSRRTGWPLTVDALKPLLGG